MNKLQMKYNLMMFVFFVVTCSINGYVTVFLQSKGLSNTEVGITTGSGCVLTVILSPYISSLVTKIKGLNIHKVLTMVMLVQAVLFAGLHLLTLPKICMMISYMLILALMNSAMPFSSMISMNLIRVGYDLNFGLARGLGSIAYALTAVGLGQLISRVGVIVLLIVYSVGLVVDLFLIYLIPDAPVTSAPKGEKTGGFLYIAKTYPVFGILLLGYSLMFAGASCLMTYLINLVRNLGASTSTYGIVVFFMSASELPVMALVVKLLKKYDRVKLMMVAAVFYTIRNIMVPFAPNLPIMICGIMLQSMSYALFTGVITYYVTSALKPQDQVMGQSLIVILSSGVGSTIGNVIGGVLQDTFGLMSLRFFVSGITMTGTLLVFLAGYKNKKLDNT